MEVGGEVGGEAGRRLPMGMHLVSVPREEVVVEVLVVGGATAGLGQGEVEECVGGCGGWVSAGVGA